jgi:site-specific DNA-cytosine methylase
VSEIEIRHFHLFAGLGGGARGFNRGAARVGNMRARFRCIGGVDVDPGAVADFERLAGARGTMLDLFDREQYVAFHGCLPPTGWREATASDVRNAAGNERPNIVFLSAPCKGFSGLLSEAKSKTDRYQALNRLTLRGVFLMLEAWSDNPPDLVLFENVPRLATRGRALLDRITAMLRSYGYATAETTHDCGELGGLAQSRKRFLLVARHIEKVPPMLYEPERRLLRSVGDVLGRMPLPGCGTGGPMHRVPSLQWKTWVRLAFVEAGSDWRSLNRLRVADGKLSDYLIVPAMHRGGYGVRAWNEPCGTVQGESRPSNGSFSVADPRVEPHLNYSHGGFRVIDWRGRSGTVTASIAPGSNAQSVADPRCGGTRHNNVYRIVSWDHHSGTVTGSFNPAGGGGVADPRGHTTYGGKGKYIVTPFGASANTVIAASTTGQGAFAVADPRGPQGSRLFGKYHCASWDTCARTVIGGDDNGAYAVADPRSGAGEATSELENASHSTGIDMDALPASDDKLVAVIQAIDGSWHRPFTTLELAALQSLFDPENPEDVAAFTLTGSSDSAWRERIGNAVPCDAACAVASEMGRTLLLAWSGESFALSAAPVWVRPIVASLSVAQGNHEGRGST